MNIITFIDNHVKTLSKYFKMRYTVIYLGEEKIKMRGQDIG